MRLDQRTSEEIIAFIEGWIFSQTTGNESIDSKNIVLNTLKGVLSYASPNLLEYKDGKLQQKNDKYIVDPKDFVCSPGTNIDIVLTENSDKCAAKCPAPAHKTDSSSKEIDMSFSEAQEFISSRGFDVPWNDGDVYIDRNDMIQTVANVLKWADEHPKNKIVWKRMPLSDVDRLGSNIPTVFQEFNPHPYFKDVEERYLLQLGNWYIPVSDLEKLPKEK